MPELHPKFSDFLSRLKGVVERKEGLSWAACCPAHPHDEKPSLSINIGRSGNLCVTCHAVHGCTAKAIMQAVGLTESALFKDDKPGFERQTIKRRPKPDAIYLYQYEDGSAAYETCRYNDPKDFAQRRPNPKWKPGSSELRYLWNLDGIRLVLYRLPRLIAELAKRPDRWVALVEGEKCSDALEALDILSTTHALGSDHWHDHYADSLTGANVAIFYDLDPYYPKQKKRPGQAWAVQAARSLLRRGCRVRICRPPLCEDDSKEDVVDYLKKASGKSVNAIKRELFKVIEDTQDYFPGWENLTGFASLQHKYRTEDIDPSADMHEIIETTVRRLNAALNEVSLSSLPADLARAAAQCQWLAETLNPKLTRENMRLGPNPEGAVESTAAQKSEPPGAVGESKSEAQEATTAENAAQALGLQSQAEKLAQIFERGSDGEPEVI